MRILTAGLTPAYQQLMLFDGLHVDRVNRATEVVWCASGKPTNAAIAVKILDCSVESVLLTPLSGPGREQMENELRTLGIRLHNVPLQSPTRICTTLIDRKAQTVTELIENASPWTDTELDQFAEAFRDESQQADAIILIGSLPRNCPGDYYRRLLQQRRRPVPVVCDFRGEELLHVLDLKPSLVKPNRAELETTFGIPLSEPEPLFQAMRQLNRMGAQWALITDGHRMVYLTSTESAFRFQPPSVDASAIVNPIGCGDAMDAALALAICRGKQVPQSVQTAMAAAALNLNHLLPGRFDASSVDEMSDQIDILPWEINESSTCTSIERNLEVFSGFSRNF